MKCTAFSFSHIPFLLSEIDEHSSVYLELLRLAHFRKHTSSLIECGEGVNIIVGNNGQGKTNILEAISFLAVTKSFLNASDGTVLQRGADVFEIEGKMNADSNMQSTVRIAYRASTAEKIFTINKKNITPRSAVIGKYPIVILSPEHAGITFGAPGERRTFMDFVLSQSSQVYLNDILACRRVIKQRNAMLSDAKRERRSVDESISSWNEQLALYGAKVMKQREQFIATFQEYVNATYRNIIAGAEEPTLAYTPQVAFQRDTTEEEIAALIHKKIEKEFPRESSAGTTLVGPHHDEVELRINGFDLRKFASQGQHKTFLIALKIAEFHYLASRCNETPILLLDDMFAELDDTRAAHVLDIVRTCGQTFVTCTNANVFDAVLEYNGKHKKIVVEEWNCSSPFWEPNSITSNISE